MTCAARPSITADTPRPPNDPLYSLHPIRPSSVLIFRKSKLRWPASACRCSIFVTFMPRSPRGAIVSRPPRLRSVEVVANMPCAKFRLPREGPSNEKIRMGCVRRTPFGADTRAGASGVAGNHAPRALVPAAGRQPDEALRRPVGGEGREGFERAHQGAGLSLHAARRQ